jgi:lipopolysaccharide transport system ATP-binding protein
LLEVGTGFHPELTGRENVYLNGAILGMRKQEIARKFDDIVDFSGISKFIDTPVKRYSSGMYVRLAFAVAAHLDPDVLIIDEVLAVGDADFQKRCVGRLSEVTKEGRTVLFVSHNMAAIQAITDRCIVLAQGRKIFSGAPREAINLYTFREKSESDVYDLSCLPRDHGGLTREVEFSQARIMSADLQSGAVTLRIRVRLRSSGSISRVRLAIAVVRADQIQVGLMLSEPVSLSGNGGQELEVETPLLKLAPGAYSLSMSINTGDSATGLRSLDVVTGILRFSIPDGVTCEGTMIGWRSEWGGCDFGLAKICLI